jgi:PAS domain S-box-containing protein
MLHRAQWGVGMKAHPVLAKRGSNQKFAGYIDEDLMQFIETVPDAMILSDPKGRIVMVNANTERMFGYSRNELIGKEVEILVPPGSRNIHQKERVAYYADPSIRKMGVGRELSACNKDGVEFPVEISLSPLKIRGKIFVWSAIRSIADRDGNIAQVLAELHKRGLILGGLISICAWCKKIHADGVWEKLEKYLESRSQAKFTHGICPDCLVRLDPASHKPHSSDLKAH